MTVDKVRDQHGLKRIFDDFTHDESSAAQLREVLKQSARELRSPPISLLQWMVLMDVPSTWIPRAVLHHPVIGLVVQPQLSSQLRLVDRAGLSPISTQERPVDGQWKMSPSTLGSNLDHRQRNGACQLVAQGSLW